MAETIYIKQDELHVENTVTTFTYGDPNPVIVISGGSGTGAFHYETMSVTGRCNVSQTGQLSFVSPGIVWVSVYKATSKNTSVIPNIVYEQSKTLMLEVTWIQRKVTVRVLNNDPQTGTDPRVIEHSVGDTTLPGFVSNVSGNFWYYPENLVSGDTIPRPTLFFVNKSDDFYHFDILCQAYGEDAYNNGIQYKKNNDGSWSVEGTATADSYYNLINSPFNIPSYITLGDQYKFICRSSVILQMLLYTGDGQWYYTSPPIYDTTEIIKIPKTVFNGDTPITGIVIRFKVEAGTTIDDTADYHILNISERSIDPYHEGDYYASAHDAILPDNIGYDSKVNYRSGILRFVNDKEYRIYTSKSGDGKIILFSNTAFPTMDLTDTNEYVKFEIKSYTGTHFEDGIANDGGSSQGSVNFYVKDLKSGNNITYTREASTPFEDKSGSGSASWLIEGTYRFPMPIGEVMVYCSFSNVMDMSAISYLSLPYTDISNVPTGMYRNALKFCLYARQVFFGEQPSSNYRAIMGGYSTTLFYEYTGGKVTYLRRKDMITAIRRISHVREDPALSREAQTVSDTDNEFTRQPKYENAPIARMFTYAGYPPEPAANFTPRTGGSTSDDVQYTNTSAVFTTASLNSYNQNSPTAALSNNRANDDYLENFRAFSPIAWGAYTGVVNGYDKYSFGPYGFATYQEATTALWRYAKFRQFDVAVTGTKPYQGDAADWAKNAMWWAIDKGILPQTKMGTATTPQPTEYIDKAEFAYMLMQFCILYAW